MESFKYEKLAEELADEIKAGNWQAGEKLPSIRALAQKCKLAKVSVQHALQVLEQRNLVIAKPKSGYYVNAKQSKPIKQTQANQSLTPKPVDMPDLFIDIMEHSAAFDIKPQYGLSASPSTTTTKLTRYLTRAQRHQPFSKSVYYSPPAGIKELREQIAKHYQKRGLAIIADDICITSGCQNSLYLSIQTICKPGDTVAVESPAFYGILQLLQQLNCKIIEIPSSPTTGINIDELTSATDNWPIKACIVTPSFATPTGAKMTSSNMQKLIALANDKNFTVIEDDVYGDVGFQSMSKPLKAFETSDVAVLCGSFSKSLSRDLRLGWVISRKYNAQLTKAKLVQQLATSQTTQRALTEFLSDGHFERHLNQYRRQLKKQRDQLLSTIQALWQFDVRYTVPDGGLALWIQLPENINTLSLYHQAIDHGIVITPGNLFSNQSAYSNFLRLSFAHEIDQSRLDAIKKLGRLIEKQTTLQNK